MTISDGFRVSYPEGAVLRRKTFEYVLRCIFLRTLDVATADGFLATDKPELIVRRNSTGNFSASIALYRSIAFREIDPANPVNVDLFEPLYVGVRLDSNATLLDVKIILQKCYAQSVDGTVQHILFLKKCPVERTFRQIRYTFFFYL